MQRGVRLFRLAGIDVYLDWSLLIIFVLIASSLALGVFPQWHPEWSGTTTLITAFVAAVLFLASVLAHEFSHALVGRANGMTVNRITLFVFGGMAQIESEPADWRSEFWMTIVGPITSLVLGFIFISLGMTMMPLDDFDPERPREFLATMTPLATLLLWLGPVNVILGLFNLVPGFPLDGGRVLRSLVWGFTGDFRRATRYASQGGQLFAWLLIASGVAMILGMRVPIFGTGLINGLWLMLIGWFLNTAAVASYRQMQSRHLLQGVPVRRVMQTQPRTVGPELSLQELVDHYLFQGEQRAYPVVSDEHLEGLVTLQEIRSVPRANWSDTPVKQVMVASADLVTVGPDNDAAEALERISQRGFNQLPVTADQRLEGLIYRQDLMRWLSLFSQD
jgi:Zn-dependent protease/CBS domain-containing protein